jgi:hypothetical protein
MQADWGGPLIFPFKYVPVTLISHIKKIIPSSQARNFYFPMIAILMLHIKLM